MQTGMLPIDVDARLQTSAGIALLEASGLVHFESGEFQSVDHDEFEQTWQHRVPAFGRLLSWNNFSWGTEMFAKGVCLANKVEIRFQIHVPDYPPADIGKWVSEYAANPKAVQKVAAVSYGTFGHLIETDYPKTKYGPAFPRLFAAVQAKRLESDLVVAAYGLLSKTIRNRDAHAYRPKVRDSHFGLVPSLFAPALNVLVSWLPSGANAASLWHQAAEPYIDTL